MFAVYIDAGPHVTSGVSEKWRENKESVWFQRKIMPSPSFWCTQALSCSPVVSRCVLSFKNWLHFQSWPHMSAEVLSTSPDLHRPGAVVWKHTVRPPCKEAFTRLRYDNKVFYQEHVFKRIPGGWRQRTGYGVRFILSSKVCQKNGNIPSVEIQLHQADVRSMLSGEIKQLWRQHVLHNKTEG